MGQTREGEGGREGKRKGRGREGKGRGKGEGALPISMGQTRVLCVSRLSAPDTRAMGRLLDVIRTRRSLFSIAPNNIGRSTENSKPRSQKHSNF